MAKLDMEVEKTATLQLIRQAIRSKNLRRLADGFDRPWARAMINDSPSNATPGPKYHILYEALTGLPKEERKKALQWTWDCYHPLMSDLGKALQEIDGHGRIYE